MSEPSSSSAPSSSAATAAESTASTAVSSSSSSTTHDSSHIISHADSSSSSSSSLLDDSTPPDELYGSHDSPSHIGLRTSHRKTKSLVHPSTTSHTPPALLRGLTLKAVHSTLSKSFSVALQFTKEKMGRADATTEEEPFLSTVAAVHSMQAHLKAIEKTLTALVAAQQSSILAHDALSAELKKLHSKELAASATPRSAPRRDSTISSAAVDPIASIEAMTSAFAESAKPEPPADSLDDVDRKQHEDEKHDEDVEVKSSPIAINTTAAPATPNLLASFYPYNRRLLAGRLTASDAFASLLSTVRLLQSTALKAALAAISQLEIDRLHYDACQANLRTLTAPDPSTPSPTPLESDQWQLATDQAQLTYLRSKAATEDRAFDLVQRVQDELQRALTAIVAVETFEWEQGIDLLRAQEEGKELEGRKKTNPWSARHKHSQDEDAAFNKEVDALR